MSSGEYGGRELERPGSPLLSWLPLKLASTLQRQDSVPRERVLEAWVYVGHEHNAWSLSSLRLSHCLSSLKPPERWEGGMAPGTETGSLLDGPNIEVNT